MANEVQVFESIASRGSSETVSANFLAKQTLTIGGAASAAFNRSTVEIEVVSTTGCVIEIGAAPDGLGITYPIVAGVRYRIGVVAGQKIIAAAGTATAPAVTDTGSAASATSLAIIDDWDESDRAKVNIIAGQVAITAGAGAVAANTPRITHASDDPAVTALNTIAANTTDLDANTDYEAVAASATNQVLGGAGATGDYLSHVTVFPASTSPGEVTIKDNATTIASFPGGVASLSNLQPFTIVLGGKSTTGAWKITTGLSVSCVAFGNFT